MIKTIIIADEDLAAALSASASPEVIRAVLNDVMTGARNEWIKLAGERLSSSRRDYINGIQNVELSGMLATVALVGVMPNNVEHGMPAYDMHTTLLGPDVPVVPWGSGERGKHARKGGGFYRVIPFRHQTPGTLGQGGGAPMGTQYKGALGDEEAKSLGKKIHKAAKKLAPTTGAPGEKTKWGERLPEGLAPKLSEKHSTDIYAGMVRQEKTYKGATQSTYTTFRVISDGVPDKWMHPGIEAVHIADDVQKYVEKVAPMAFAALFGG